MAKITELTNEQQKKIKKLEEIEEELVKFKVKKDLLEREVGVEYAATVLGWKVGDLIRRESGPKKQTYSKPTYLIFDIRMNRLGFIKIYVLQMMDNGKPSLESNWTTPDGFSKVGEYDGPLPV